MRRYLLGIGICSTILAIIEMPQLAYAEPVVETLSERTPWTEGVTEEQRQAARLHLEAGNRLFRKKSVYTEALAEYTRALNAWNHPGIHYNIGLTRIQLDQPLEAYRSFEAALRFEALPIGEERYVFAKNYLTLLENQVLARIELTCNQSTAEITLDGKSISPSGRTFDTLLLAGEHQIVASSPGFLTASGTINLPAGKTTQVTLTLVPIDRPTKTHRRWAPWKPWVVTAGGAAALIGGMAIHAFARNNFRGFDREFHDLCHPGGCLHESLEFKNQLDNGNRQQSLASLSYTVGGVVLVSGIVMLALNRPITILDGSGADESTIKINIGQALPRELAVNASLRF